MGVHVKVAGAWQEIGVDGGGGLQPAVVTGGTVTTYSADGVDYEVHTFTSDGTLSVVQAGVADILVVGGGGSGAYTDAGSGGGGGGGGVLDGAFSLDVGDYPVKIGAGGTTVTSKAGGVSGRPSYFDDLTAGGGGGGGGWGTRDAAGTYPVGSAGGGCGSGGTAPVCQTKQGNNGHEDADAWAANGGGGGGAGAAATNATGGAGRTLYYSGVAVEYGKGGNGGAGAAAGAANTGQGGGGSSNANSGPGGSGIVIVRTVVGGTLPTGVIASGGTETTYVGDGTNGVLGQSYKVHKFTADGTFTVTQGGEADVLVVGAGGSGTGGYGGGGGGVLFQKVALSPGAMPVTVGQAGVVATLGGASQLGSLAAIGGSYVNSDTNNIHRVGSAAGANGGRPTPGQGFGGDGGTGAGGAGGAAVGSTPGPGRTLTISGTAVEYGAGGKVSVEPPANSGWGGGYQTSTGQGAHGVVIVRYEIA